MTRSIALVAMLLRALLPMGWMPNPTGSSGAALVLCTMDGSVHLLPGADRQPLKQQPDQNNDRNQTACPFAAAPHLATPTIAAALAPPALAQSVAAGSVHVRLADSAAGYTPHSPRAPPSLV